MKKILKKLFLIFMVMPVIFQSIAPTVVFALSYEDGNVVTLDGSPVLNGTNFQYAHGNVKVTKNGVDVTTTTFSVEKDDNIVIKLLADENYLPVLSDQNGNNISLIEGSYSFTIGQKTSNTLHFTPSFEEDRSSQVIKYDFRLNGVDFTNVGNGDTLSVSNEFNFDAIDEFYIKSISINGVSTYTYSDNEYSYDLLDDQDRNILEINASKTSENFVKIRIESHPDDILAKDIVQGKTKSDYYKFYIPEISLKKEGFKGVEVTTSVMPDSYDFTTWNGVDLSSTTEENPGSVTVYYGEDTINLSNDNISEIILVPDKGVPASAVSIDNEEHTVTVLSNYYNEIPLKVKLNDGTVGYINVNRIGLFISSLNKGATEFYHGASADVGQNLDVDTDKDRIVAVFYHEDSRPYLDYKLIVNITYEDGTTETTIAEGVGDVHNSSGNIIGSDYILWKGNDNMPAKVSVIAVDAEALTDEETFGGAMFGSGSGVEWERH